MWDKCNGKIWGKDLGPESSIYVNSFKGTYFTPASGGSAIYAQLNINGWMFEFNDNNLTCCAASNDWGWVFKEAA